METEADFDGVEAVIAEPLKFKAKLAIGENAYSTLRNANKVREYWDLLGAASGGAAVASSTAVATTFFAPTGFWAILGFGTAVTPVGWVIAAAVVSGGAWYGIQKGLRGATASRVTIVPKFINTPIDVLAVSLFDLLAPLALKMAHIDGPISNEERSSVKRYLVREWGYDVPFVDAGIQQIEKEIEGFTIEDISRRLAEFKKSSPDCNYDEMCRDILVFLREVTESDGFIDEREELALCKIQLVFEETGKSAISKSLEGFRKTASVAMKGSAEKLSEAAEVAEAKTRETMATLAKTERFNQAVATASRVKDVMGDGAYVAAEAASSALDATSKAISKFAARLKRPPPT